MSQTEPASAARDEAAIFADLGALCASSGFAEVIAQMCADSNYVLVTGGLTGESLSKLYDGERLLRTEIAVLVGLLARGPVDEATISRREVGVYVASVKTLFEELHDALSEPWRPGMRALFEGRGSDQTLNSGAALREPFFYSGESAFSHQYRDFAAQRYAADDSWLRANRGFSISFARDVVAAVSRLQAQKVLAALDASEADPDHPPSLLPAFIFTAEEVAAILRTSAARVEPVLKAFAAPEGEGNPTFDGIQDFNITNAAPLLTLTGGRFLLFQIYSLSEALYESPAFWMLGDREYRRILDNNRGNFPEQFSYNRLAGVFGRSSVHLNVELPGGRKARRGEIDVLVVFGEQAIVVQAKAKRMTIAARGGADGSIRQDFQAAIQDACDQAQDCAKALLDGHPLRANDGRPIVLPPIRRVYPLCLVADHYPALAAQVRQFLRWEAVEGIAPPMVTDLFALDALTEMLGSPLRVLNYLSLRARFIDRMMFNHEFVLLGVHLKQNLWVEDGYDQAIWDDSLSADLDAAMAVRRDGVPGARIPPGVLTRMAGTALAHVIDQIERRPEAVELGLELLQLGEESHLALSHALEHMAALWRQDGRRHDFSIPLQDGGVTFHVTAEGNQTARERLEAHCILKKHQQKADRWHGLLVDPRGLTTCGALRIEGPWEPDAELDDAGAWLQVDPITRRQVAALKLSKPGRNAPCPCGSRKKFKHCHGGRP